MAKQRFTLSALMLMLVVTAGGRAASLPQLDSRLAEAVKRGDKPAVMALLHSHVPVDSAEGDGSTALHWAAYHDNRALAELLLNAGASVNVTTRVGALTPLFIACQNGSASMIEALLKHGADANGANALGTTPLMVAAASGSADAVKMLVDHGANVNARENVHDQTALMFAANEDRAEVIRVLLAHGADANAASRVVTPPKLVLKKDGNLAAIGTAKDVKAAEEAQAKEPNEGEASTGGYGPKETPRSAKKTEDDAPGLSSPKAEVASTGDADAAKSDTAKMDAAKKPVRRERGAKAMGGMTPLLYAARQGNIAAGTALLEGGAKINDVSGSEHSTPLVLAIANGHLDFAKMLVDHGADVNLANEMGVAPLFATIDVRWVPHEWSPEPITDQEKTDYLQLMKMLLAHGADPNARLGRQVWSRVMSENRNWTDPAGATAFWRAAQANDLKAMHLLKDSGADTNIPSTIGVTPLMVAAGLGWAANYSTTSPERMGSVQYCLSLDADVNAHDNMGYTALHGAAFVGDLTIIQYLVDHGARTDVKTKAGDTVADLANGPFEKSLPNPDAVVLLEKLGSPNSHNCRSSDCFVPVKEDKKPAAVAAADVKKP